METFVRLLVDKVQTRSIPTEVHNHNQIEWLKTKLSEAGFTDFGNYKNLSELEALWKLKFIDRETKEYYPIYSMPSYETLYICYRHLLYGLVKLQAIRFKAIFSKLISIDDNNMIVENYQLLEDDATNDVIPQALWSISVADPLLKNFMKSTHINAKECIIEFNFTDYEGKAITRIYYNLFPNTFDWLENK